MDCDERRTWTVDHSAGRYKGYIIDVCKTRPSGFRWPDMKTGWGKEYRAVKAEYEIPRFCMNLREFDDRYTFWGGSMAEVQRMVNRANEADERRETEAAEVTTLEEEQKEFADSLMGDDDWALLSEQLKLEEPTYSWVPKKK